jgi:spermidine/putrescine ABC transporter ATP-binding subunit
MTSVHMRDTQSAKSGSSANGVEVRDISKRFGDVPALQPTSFIIESGSFVTLLGPSGSGKTTLLKIIAGFEDPTTGSVLINGVDMTDTAPHRRNIGFVFQQYALFPHMTVAQNIAYPLEMKRLARNAIRERVDQTLEFVRLTGLADRKPTELSGGQQQRVALARAIIFNPPLLLMDEPLAALDKRLREEMQFEIRRMQRELKITTIAVTHDQSEALVMSDRIFVLKNGALQQTGCPESLYQSPENEFVATFVGESNILNGKVAAVDGRLFVVLGDGLCIPIGEGRPPAGADVTCVLRPEAIELGQREADLAIGLNAEVVERIFCGDTLRLRLRLDKAPKTTLLAKVRALRSSLLPEVGSSVRLGWRPEDLIVIERTEGGRRQ